MVEAALQSRAGALGIQKDIAIHDGAFRSPSACFYAMMRVPVSARPLLCGAAARRMLSLPVVQRPSRAARGAAGGGSGDGESQDPVDEEDAPPAQSPTGPDVSGDSVGRIV